MNSFAGNLAMIKIQKCLILELFLLGISTCLCCSRKFLNKIILSF